MQIFPKSAIFDNFPLLKVENMGKFFHNFLLPRKKIDFFGRIFTNDLASITLGQKGPVNMVVFFFNGVIISPFLSIINTSNVMSCSEIIYSTL